MTALTRDEAWKMVQKHPSRQEGNTTESSIVCCDVDAKMINRNGWFDAFIQWMCQRSTYLVFAESQLSQDQSPEDYASDIFGWVEYTVTTDSGYSSWHHTNYYFLPCHAGQYVPLLSVMNGLHSFNDDCPLHDVAFFGADGMPRLKTITHEKMAWVTLSQQELQEATSSGQEWLRALRAQGNY